MHQTSMAKPQSQALKGHEKYDHVIDKTLNVIRSERGKRSEEKSTTVTKQVVDLKSLVLK